MKLAQVLTSLCLLTPLLAQPVSQPPSLPHLFSRAPGYGSCPAASWPPLDVGVPLVPQMPDGELSSMLAQVSPANIEATIRKLVSFGTRHTLSTQNSTTRGIGAARDWIFSEMQKIANSTDGRMTAEVISYTQGLAERITFPVVISDVVGTLKGTDDPDRFYVISGHYDSRVTDVLNFSDDAPGADDDASGVAVVLELARVMSQHQPKASIIFTAVAGEEQGLYGSNFLAETLANSSTRVEGMLNNDIVGSSTSDHNTTDPFDIRCFAQGPPSTENATVAAQRLSIGGENDSPARELARFVGEVATNNATGMNVAVIYRLDRFLRSGDQLSFLQQGYPAVRFTEPNENFAHQHQDVRVEDGVQFGDLPQFVDFDFTARVARVNGAALWSLANAPGLPTNVRVNTTALDNNSKLSWQLTAGDNADLVAGYEIVWRPTDAPLWTHMADVGKVNGVTVPASKDNVIFGVRSYGPDGYKSPAVFPFPIA